MEPPQPTNLDLLSRVYWASALAAKLQSSTPIFDETPLNRNDVPASSGSSVARILNHLCTCLSQCTTSEASRVVAVTSCTYEVGGVRVQVFGSPPTSPKSSPHVSPSSSSLLGVKHSASDVQASALILTRNTAPELPKCKIVRERISMDDAKALSLIKDIIEHLKTDPMSDIAIPSPDFAPYVGQSLRVLRGAAAAGLNTSEDANVRRAICFYFVTSCLGKLKSRAKAFSKLYQLEELLGWANQKDPSIKAEEFSIDNSLVELGFKQTEFQSIKDTGRERIFELNTLNAPACWKVLIGLFKTLMNLIGTPADVSGIVQVSVAIHHLLKQLPTQFWKLPSLNKHLTDCWERRTPDKLSDGPSTSGTTHENVARQAAEKDAVPEHPSTPIAVPSVSDAEEFAREDEQAIQDEAEALNNLPATRPLSDALPFCRSFYRAADATTAWTTAPMALLRSRISTASPIDVTIVDLPQLPISTTTVQELVGCWDQSGAWTTTQRDTVSEALASIDPSTTPALGACHAEACLIASALVRTEQRPRSKTGVQSGRDDIGQEEPEGRDGGGEGRGSIQNEPDELKNVFEDVFDQGPSELKLAIGVAKKCCPVCHMLTEAVQERYNVSLDLPGQHGRIHPWVPPAWLPPDVLLDLEKRLLVIIIKLVTTPLPGSRASSPDSDSDWAHEAHPKDPNLDSTKTGILLLKNLAASTV